MKRWQPFVFHSLSRPTTNHFFHVTKNMAIIQVCALKKKRVWISCLAWARLTSPGKKLEHTTCLVCLLACVVSLLAWESQFGLPTLARLTLLGEARRGNSASQPNRPKMSYAKMSLCSLKENCHISQLEKLRGLSISTSNTDI